MVRMSHCYFSARHSKMIAIARHALLPDFSYQPKADFDLEALKSRLAFFDKSLASFYRILRHPHEGYH